MKTTLAGRTSFGLARLSGRIAIAVLVGLPFTAESAFAADSQVTVARFGTSTVGSTYYVIANGLANLARKHADVTMTVEPIGGTHANVFSLQAGKIDYAITNSGGAYDGYHGNEPFDRPADIRLMAQGQSSFRFYLVRRNKSIETPKDLQGEIIIGRRPALPEMAEISNALVRAANITDVKLVSTKNTKESLKHIRSGTVAGISIPGGGRLPAVVELFRDDLVDPLYIDPETIAAMQQQLPPYMYTHTFPAGHFEGQEKEFTVFGLNTYLIAGPETSEEQVYSIVKTLFEFHEEFSTYHSEAKEWTVENSLSDPQIPFHPGAIRYFKEKNLWTEDLEQRQVQLKNR